MAPFSGRARWALPLLLSLAIFATPEQALAQATPQADGLFAEGRDLLEKGKFNEACAKLAKSQELSAAVGTLINLAYCYEQLGKLRSAMDAYVEAETLAAGAADSKRAAFAKERFLAIEPRAAKLVVRVTPPEIAGLEVKRNGVAIPKIEFDRPIAVDPQDYVITASAPGRATWKGTIIVRGEGAVVTMIVPPLDAATGPAAPTTQAAFLSPRKVLALGLGGLGALTIGAGIAGAFSAKSRYDDASAHCDDTGCDETGNSIQRGAVTQGNIATVLMGFGLLSTAAGVYLWITDAPESKAAPARARSVRLEVRPLGAGIGGRF
jgi:hypothetical protein